MYSTASSANLCMYGLPESFAARAMVAKRAAQYVKSMFFMPFKFCWRNTPLVRAMWVVRFDHGAPILRLRSSNVMSTRPLPDRMWARNPPGAPSPQSFVGDLIDFIYNVEINWSLTPSKTEDLIQRLMHPFRWMLLALKHMISASILGLRNNFRVTIETTKNRRWISVQHLEI